MKDLLLTFLLALSAIASQGQMLTGKFIEFAQAKDSLFNLAYEKKDIKSYQKHLTHFLSEYNKLPDTEQREFSYYLQSAYYNLCCTYALLANKPMALLYFKKSVEAGYRDYNHMLEDHDLDLIRNEQEFKDLLANLRATGDFLYILKKAGDYNSADQRSFPGFTYQPADSPKLRTLRGLLPLDSIAGKGTDVSKIINLMHWVHYLVPHDGNHENPVVKNTLNMIGECRLLKRGLNCRGLATVLNECYLAMGFRSRIVTCLPKDSLKIDYDCHVINMVYSDTLKKWLWMDPTNDAYVMNEKGELLSIAEVRERIIDDRPMILNPDANWNRQSITKEYYLYQYMAKNLYILECPVSSEYNMETREKGKVLTYVRLLPLEYYQQSPDKFEEKAEDGTIWITYKTNNPELFWKSP